MKCPLPVDWLDAIESGREDELDSHLAQCPSCRALVESLRDSVRGTPTFRIDTADWKPQEEILASAPHWTESEEKDVNYGQIWLTRSEFAFDSVSYSDIERVFVVVLDNPTEEYGWSWVPVAPLLTDTDNVTVTDLILRSTDTTLNVPFGAYFRYQTLLAVQQLETYLGELTAEGREVFGDVVAGSSEDAPFGTSLEATDDLRLVRTEFLRDAVEKLGAVYAQATGLFADATAEEASVVGVGKAKEVLREFTATTHEKLSNVISLTRWDPRGNVVVERLAAAAGRQSDDAFISYFRAGYGASEVRAALEWDAEDDRLFFWFERLEEQLRGAQVVVCLVTESGEQIVSEPFEATPDERVAVAEARGVLPRDLAVTLAVESD